MDDEIRSSWSEGDRWVMYSLVLTQVFLKMYDLGWL